MTNEASTRLAPRASHLTGSRNARRPGTSQDQVQITYGTALAEAGVDLAVIQALLGHAHVDSSVGYIHLAPVRVRAAYDTARERQRHQLRGLERHAQG